MSGSTTGTQAVDRAAALLTLVVRSPDGMTFTDLCAETGMARSTTSRLLAALERSSLLARDAAGTWVPGQLFASYAASHSDDDELARLARPAMEQLSEITGETINLGVPRAGTVRQVAQVASTYMLGSRDWVGVEVPAHVSALGKVLYAFEALEAPEGALAYAPGCVARTSEELRAEFPVIRTRGFAVTVNELEVGLTGIAAPVFDDGTAVAALGLSGPTGRLADEAQRLGPVVARHAGRLSQHITEYRKERAA